MIASSIFLRRPARQPTSAGLILMLRHPSPSATDGVRCNYVRRLQRRSSHQSRPATRRGSPGEGRAVFDEREAVLEFIHREVESFGGRIRDVFCDRVIAEFPGFPFELCDKIDEKGWQSWLVEANEVTIFLR